jgi:hypothetical protein
MQQQRKLAGIASLAILVLPDLARAADCTFTPEKVRSQREIWHRISREAEAVAPSRLQPATDATATSRRRSVPQPSFQFNFTARNFIDTEIFGKMAKDKVRWTTPASDEEFLRRVTLDLTGQIPTADKVKSFVADTSATKRDKVIDELLASEEFADRWTLWFGDLVGNVFVVPSSGVILYSQGRNGFYTFIRDSMRAGKPYDALVREVITARGSNYTNGPANYWVRQILTNGPVQDTFDNLSADTAEKFLGLPLTCISCHNGLGHLEAVNLSLSKRTREEFWKNAAFFAKEMHRAQRANNRVEWFIEDNPNPVRSEYLLNTTSGNKTPRQAPSGQSNIVPPVFFLSGETPQPGEPRRPAYARILTAHPQFARASVNYIWKEIFGLGIVEPADSFDLLRQDPATIGEGLTVQPTHPRLITQLGDHFVASGYSLRALLKTIVSSNTYQLSSVYTTGEWNEIWTPYYARHYPHRMLAESVVDAITRATGVRQNYTVEGLTIERAMQLPDPTEPRGRQGAGGFMSGFGRGDRDTALRTNEGSIVQALSLLNDSFVTTRVRSLNNSTVQRLLAQTQDRGTLVDELYIATLSRRPTAAERAAGIAALNSGDLSRKTEDLQYALINRLEFLYN